MTDETVEPALTPEEWADRTTRRMGRGNYFRANTHEGDPELTVGMPDAQMERLSPTGRHALAALALHEQEFGFTWEDVDLLRGLHDYTRGEENQSAMADLADRIAALLPPREDP